MSETALGLGHLATMTSTFLLLCGFAIVARTAFNPDAAALTNYNLGQFASLGDNEAASSPGGSRHGDPNYCLSSNSDLRRLINTTNQVLIMAPPKAAGTSMIRFDAKCTNVHHAKMVPGSTSFLNHQEQIETLLTYEYDVPRVISAHGTGTGVANLVRKVPRSTLVIMIHRPETNRVLSGIKMVVMDGMCRRCVEHGKCSRRNEFERVEGNNCYMPEQNLVDIIKSKRGEINSGFLSGPHTCDIYDSIRRNAPTVLLVDFKRATELQNLLSEKYCPEQLGQFKQVNVAAQKENQVYITLPDEGTVTLEDWLDEKASILELALDLRNGTTCQATTRQVEDALYGCEEPYLDPVGILGP